MLERLLHLKRIPLAPDFGRLFLRVTIPVFLFVNHGLPKLTRFATTAHSFPDPLHIGSTSTLIISIVADCLCAALLLLGLATRLAAAYASLIYIVAFLFVQHFTVSFASSRGPAPGGRGADILAMYLGTCLALLFLGAGKYSIDARLHVRPEPEDA